jgi:protease secretion system membrane fusion protein
MNTTPTSTPIKDGQVVNADNLQNVSTLHRLGRWIIALGLLALLAWAAVAPLDEGVPAEGLVTLDTKRKSIQHLQGGIVREVLVKEGQQVSEGQVVMTLETAVPKAQLESVRQHYLALRAAESRLMSERAGLTQVRWHTDLLSSANDPLTQPHLQVQNQLFQSRRSALQATLQGLAESQAGVRAQLDGNARMLEQRKRQLALFNEEINNIADLVKEGYAPRARLNELQRNAAEVASTIADLESSSVKLVHSLEELDQRSHQLQFEAHKELDGQLADIRREVQADSEKLAAVTQDMERTEIKAPATGQVVGLTVQTIGAVVAPGQRLMDIVPEHAPLIIEARIPPSVIDRVQAGLMADVRFSAFAHSPQLLVQAKVASISQDIIVEPETRQSFFLARLTPTPEGLAALGSRSLQSGMMAEVVIRTGERSLLTYLAYPFVRRLSQSMKEE